MTDAKKRANKKWAKKNMTCLTCAMPKAEAEKYKRIAADRGVSVNAILKAALTAFEKELVTDEK